ncbi:uncharacterized protein TEOVI_000134900 [Trypanosoma equiperdum]|nr:hypothetical protein, conserved [Trypanosoma equiperdum]
MNVAELLKNRVEEVAAFSTLLFRKRPRDDGVDSRGGADVDDTGEQGSSCGLPKRPAVPLHRRPSSSNVPLCNMKRHMHDRMRHASRDPRRQSTREAIMLSACTKKPKKRLFTYSQWCSLLRRRRRVALRRRPTTRRRLLRRIFALRYGKYQKPLCNCAMPNHGTILTGAVPGRTSILWLPSHWYMRRRFHYCVEKAKVSPCPNPEPDLAIVGGGSGRGTPSCTVTLRIAVPLKCQRKQHRILQRWVARLPTFVSSQMTSKVVRQHRGKLTAVPPPMCFVAERSHMCVWRLQQLNMERRFSPEELMNLLIMRTNENPPAMGYTKSFRLSKTTPDPTGGTWQTNGCSVYYGYVWSAAAKAAGYPFPQDACTVQSNPVVAVTLVLVRDGKVGRGDTYYLIAPCPVYFGPQARRHLSFCLISHWNPCPAVGFLSSMLEVWCCAGAAAQECGEKAVLPSHSWVRQRVDKAMMRWHSATAGKSESSEFLEAENSNVFLSTKSSSLTPTKRALGGVKVFTFPSFPPFTDIVDCTSFPIHQCVVTVLAVSVRRIRNADALGSSRTCNTWSYRACHFQLSRHLFSSVVSPVAATWRQWCDDSEEVAGTVGLCRSNGYAYSARAIGEEERETLQLLSGCYALFGRESARNVWRNSGVARLYHSPSNAHQRVLLKFSARGGRQHQEVGGALLLLKPKDQEESGATLCVTIPELTRIGTIATAPFFSMRFGCCLAYAWVWDHAGWKSLISDHCRRAVSGSRSSQRGDVVNEGSVEDPNSKNTECCFVCSNNGLLALLPYLREVPTSCKGGRTTVPGKTKRGKVTTAMKMKKWKEVQSKLCDIDVCTPVDIVRLTARS